MSVIFVTLELSTRLLQPLRSSLVTLVSPLQVIAETPYLLGDSVGEVVASRESLKDDNARLQRRILELSQISQQFLSLRQENSRLRELLGSRARLPTEVLIAELVGVVPGVGTHQVIIDKGTEAGVAIGQPVIDAQGLFGQVVEAGRFTSRVLQVTDVSHALPVQINRNGIRSVAGGSGRRDALELENVPITADIREGDLVETSGLAGRFPMGYPVGYVSSVVIDDTSAYASVTVRPSALLDRSRHVLLLFAQSTEPAVLESDVSPDLPVADESAEASAGEALP